MPVNGLALNLILALVWALFLGEVNLRSLSIGFGLGFGVMTVFHRALGSRAYVRSVGGALRLVAYFVAELVRANVQMARLALRPHPPLNQMIVAVPLRLRGEGALTLLTALTGLMPGTVTLGFAPEQDRMYVHATGLENGDAVRRSVQEIETRLLQVLGEKQPSSA
ncbi:Na+/H+ antiporter subunit E [Deinococcus wulumuqiensis R12]|uniref:Monovalent cation/H+ antiporter subunit E n=1 Tax=Deinococcus wulumuqiensis TaxID=980427 RepID=A0AAV4K8N3_9DEIO|nr:Na+/H+ antiporter subunit E [Deinococcus wulumuqiensis R12]GGI89674.1 putative monovalent cation/H+ antiporter subunit E [Deinococcus wulumuqiensis]GGP30607.1 putative monovalent cation/H+ antiporter subunit E [Deinococcus wulumuqiensis]